MTLDETIERFTEMARGNDQQAKDYAQLDNWLRELRRARMEIDILKMLRNGFKADTQKYKDENDRLKALCKHLRECKRNEFCVSCKYVNDACDFDHDMRELGIEVE